MYVVVMQLGKDNLGIVDVILDFQRNCLEMMSLMEYYY